MRAVAKARREHALARTAGLSAVAALTAYLLGGPAPLIWLAGLIAFEIVDYFVQTCVLKETQKRDGSRRGWRLVTWTFARASYGAIIATMLWSAKYLHGEVLAVLFLVAALMNVAITMRAAPIVSRAAAMPPLMALIGLPLNDYLFINGRNALDLAPLAGILLLCAYGLNLWRSLAASDVARAEAEASAQRERASAAAAAAAKTETIQRIKAELRTPMAALAGAAEHLKRAATTPQARAHIGAIVHAGDVLQLVLDDLSDLDGLERGEVRIETKAVDPRELAKSVVGAFRAEAHDKGLELLLDISRNTPALVEIDPLRVRQVLCNLVANGVRYTSNGGVRVRLQVQQSARADLVRLGFVVADTGAGMSRSQLAMALAGDNSARTGQGLGLVISARLARLMGGKLGGRSELGEGSMFSFVIEAPVLSAEAAA